MVRREEREKAAGEEAKHKEEEVSTQVLGSLYKKAVRGNASAWDLTRP